MHELGNTIRRLRKKQRMSRGELASKASLQRIDVVRIEKGELHPDLDQLVELIGALGVEADAWELPLLGRSTQPRMPAPGPS